MKNISKNLQNLLNEENTNFVKCYKFTLNNNTILGFTDYSKNIIYDNIEYKSNSLFENKNINSSDLPIINQNIIYGCIDEDFTENDIKSGKFLNSKFEIFLINYEHPNNGIINLFTGYIKSISIYDNVFIATVCNIIEHINKQITETYSEFCRCKFCDSKCSLNKDNYKENGIVNKVINNKNFTTNSEKILSKADNYYNDGIIEFTSGNNKGEKNEIKFFNEGNFILKYEMPTNIEINDTFIVYKNCDKSFYTCSNIFNNAINFRGEPNIPRTEKIYNLI